MKLKLFTLIFASMLAVSAFAQGPVGAGTDVTVTPAPKSKRAKKPYIKRLVIASAACGVGIGLSANPATAAEIGLPILIGGNYIAWRLYQNHPKWSAIIQYASPLGCFGYGLKHAPPKHIKTTKPPTGGGSNPPPPPHGNPPPGGGNPPPGGGGNPPPPGGGNPPPGGGNPPPGGGGNPPPNPPPTHGGGPCIQDCGFPGNSGVNGGHDVNKPPFPGKGNGGVNIGNGQKP